MRPVNLIPPEERRGERAPTRTGPAAYAVVAALALGVAGVTAVVLTNNQISDRRGEVAQLEAREAAAREQAEALAPYAEFAALKEARLETVSSLARSRFDWERVLRELALVIPQEIQLTNVTGTVAPDVAVGGAGTNALRDGAPGPALQITGCAADHSVVAELAAALEDIDGVTRVGVQSSARPGGETASADTAGCDTDEPLPRFEILAAFDEVTAGAEATAPEGAPDGGLPVEPAEVADAGEQQDQARESIAEQSGEARDAAGLVTGAVR